MTDSSYQNRLFHLANRAAIVGFFVPVLFFAVSYLVPGDHWPPWIPALLMLVWPLAGIWGLAFLDGGERFETAIIVLLVFFMCLNALYFWVLGAFAHHIRTAVFRTGAPGGSPDSPTESGQ